MKNSIKKIQGEYYSTYAFVDQNNCQELADQVLGIGWEAEDDCNQIMMIIEAMNIGDYSVDCMDGYDYIIVREL